MIAEYVKKKQRRYHNFIIMCNIIVKCWTRNHRGNFIFKICHTRVLCGAANKFREMSSGFVPLYTFKWTICKIHVNETSRRNTYAEPSILLCGYIITAVFAILRLCEVSNRTSTFCTIETIPIIIIVMGGCGCIIINQYTCI